jgi:hypothetical protein
MDETRCHHCHAIIDEDQAAATLALRGDHPPTFPDGRPRPDLLGLGVWLVGALEHREPDEDDADLFLYAFMRWTGASPLAFVESMRHAMLDTGCRVP